MCPLQYATFDKDLIFHNYKKNERRKTDLACIYRENSAKQLVYFITISSNISLLLVMKSDVKRIVPAYHIPMVREIESAASLTAIILKDEGGKTKKRKIQVQLTM